MKVSMVAAMTICGTISPAPLGSRLDRNFLEELRARTAGSLIGAGTLRQANPEMRGPAGRFLEGRLRGIVSASGNIPVEGRNIFLTGPRPVIFTACEMVQPVSRLVNGRAEVLGLQRNASGLCLVTLLELLRQKGMQSLLVEGGGIFNYSCLQQQIVDELFLTVVPFFSGDHSATRLIDGAKPLGPVVGRAELVSCRQQNTGELFLHYRLSK